MQPDPEPSPITLVWPLPAWSVAAMALGGTASVVGGALALWPLGLAVAGLLAGNPWLAGAGVGAALAALLGGGAFGLAGFAGMTPWSVRVDRSGVTAGRLGLLRRPRSAIGSVHVAGAWGTPIRITLDDGTPLWVEGSAAVHERRDHDPDRLRERAREVARVLGVPLVDELADAASFTARRLEALGARQAAIRAARDRNRAAHPALHAAPPVEPRSTWSADELGVWIGVPGRWVSVGPDRVTGPWAFTTAWTIDDVHVGFETSLGKTTGTIHLEVDGHTGLFLQSTVSTPEHAGHLHWLADVIRRTARRARASRADRAGTVPEALRALRRDPRTQERPPG